jgi:mono/diheme cytochrome c family protein
MRIIRFLHGFILVATSIGIVLPAVWVVSASPASAADAAKGKTIFTKSCGGCHGETGKGDGAAAAALNPKPKDLSDKTYNSKLDDAYLHNIITKGGAAVGKAPLMPSFSSQLKEQDINDVVAYIRSLAK